MDADKRAPASAGSVVFTAALWFASGFIFVGAFEFPYPANVAPMALGAVGTALLGGILAHEAIGLIRRVRSAAAAPDAGADEAPEAAAGPRRAEPAALAWAVASIALVIVLGFLAGMTLAMIGFLRGYARESWRVTLALTGGVLVSLYLAFGVVLEVPLYGGLFELAVPSGG